MTRRIFLGSLALVLLGCGGGGRYGYARSYSYYGAEESFARRANSAAIYDEVQRLPHRFQAQTISWFGVVTSVENGSGGVARVTMQVRTHQERHLCEDETESSCRVTVNERDGGAFTALVQLSPEDHAGENRVQAGSLLRVYGPLVTDDDATQNGPVLRAEHYRHWPRGQYVTTAAAASWRR
jgi:hypothetical protein